MTKFNSIADVNAYVSKFQSAKTQMLASSGAFMVKGRHELYTMLGEAKVACDALLDPANAVHLAAALKERQLRPAKPDKLVYSPIVAMLFGEFDHEAPKVTFEGTKGLTPFVRDRSAEKYSHVMFWFEHHKITSEYAERLEACENKMDGAIKEVRELRNDKSDEDEAVVEKRIELLLEVGSYEPFHSTAITLPPDQGRFGALWYEVVNGEVRIRGTLPTKSEAIARQVAAQAKAQEAALKEMRAEREKQARLQNMEEDAALAIVKANPKLLESLRKQAKGQREAVEG